MVLVLPRTKESVSKIVYLAQKTPVQVTDRDAGQPLIVFYQILQTVILRVCRNGRRDSVSDLAGHEG